MGYRAREKLLLHPPHGFGGLGQKNPTRASLLPVATFYTKYLSQVVQQNIAKRGILDSKTFDIPGKVG
jgi:hypothetical protein